MDRRHFMRVGLGLAGMACVSPAWASYEPDRLRMELWRERRRFATTRFGSIAYVESGEGEPALFLHGYPLSSFQWRGAVERLDLFHRCIALDFMGLGATEVSTSQDLGAASQAAMVIAFLDKLGIERVHLVANDSGGAVAQLIAVDHPHRLRSLILTNCDTELQSPPPAMLPVIELSKKGQYAEQWLMPWYKDRQRARAPDQLGGLCYADPANPTDPAIEEYLGPLLARPERRRQVEAHAIAQEKNALAGIAPRLRQCKVPTRIIWGMADSIFDPGNADYLDTAFGNSRGVRRLEGARLFWPEERPGVIAEEVRILCKEA